MRQYTKHQMVTKVKASIANHLVMLNNLDEIKAGFEFETALEDLFCAMTIDIKDLEFLANR